MDTQRLALLLSALLLLAGCTTFGEIPLDHFPKPRVVRFMPKPRFYFEQLYGSALSSSHNPYSKLSPCSFDAPHLVWYGPSSDVGLGFLVHPCRCAWCSAAAGSPRYVQETAPVGDRCRLMVAQARRCAPFPPRPEDALIYSAIRISPRKFSSNNPTTS